jgi:hypothetical protein
LQRRELTQGGYWGKLMNIADQFVVGLVDLAERHNQMHGAEYYKPKHESKLATRLNHNEHELNKATENKNTKL